MIRGVFSCMSGNIILSAISDNSQLQISRKRKLLSDDIEETFKHSVSLNSLIGTLIVDNNDSSAYFSHSNCKGIKCACRNIAIKFLNCKKTSNNTESSSFIGRLSWFSDLEEDFVNCLSYPYLVILSQGSHNYLVTKYSASDHHIERLGDGNYFINDYILTTHLPAQSKLQDIIVELQQPQFFISADKFKDYSNDIAAEIQATFRGWPLHCSGYGITLLKFFGESRSTITPPLAIGRAVFGLPSSPTSKPKRPVTGFNFFSKETRNELQKEYNFMLTNNQLNKVIGQRWTDLPDSDRQYYLDKAVRDKERYAEELALYYAQKSLTFQLQAGESLDRPVTAYNLFVRQEKQYVFMTELINIQTKMGKHGGDRWCAMEENEKKLYLAIRDMHPDNTSIENLQKGSKMYEISAKDDYAGAEVFSSNYGIDNSIHN